MSGGVSAWHLGLVLATWPVGTALAAPVLRHLPNAIRASAPMGLGLFLCAGGLIGVALFLWIGGSFGIAAMLLLAGVGLGFFRIGAINQTTDILPPEDRGVAGSLYNVMQVLGFVFGASFLLTFLAWVEGLALPVSGFAVTFATFGGLLGIYAVVLAGLSRAEPLKGG
jgi:DHA2 family multidrug resistance protein-like MFS transporter